MEAVLREAVTPKFIALYLYIASVCYIHFRSKVRLKFRRQLLEHSGILSPYNALMYLFSAVPTTPYLDRKLFPEMEVLRDNWETIRDEAKALYEGGSIRSLEKHNDLAFQSFYKYGWKRFYLKWYDSPMPSAEKLCPKTVELVKSIPNINAVAFTLLPPHSILGKHRDPLAASLRYHMGLITPNSDDCTIWVDGEPHSWRDGEDVYFDETYVHWVRNDTDDVRIILFADITRPLHTMVMRAINRFMIRYVVRATKSQNTEDEKVGALNKVSGYIYAYKMFLLKVKRANRPLYYIGKYVFILGLAYLIFGRGFNLL